MKKSATYLLVFLATVLLSTPALATIKFTDDFESYPVYQGEDPWGSIGNGWLFWANVYGNYPGCTDKWYDYGGPHPAPNGPQISNIVAGATGNALNKFSDYNNANHGDGACIETNVFQERVVNASDSGFYTFRFETQVPGPLGENVKTIAFIKLLNPATGWSLDEYIWTSTADAGAKFLNLRLDATSEGKVLQWGFQTIASNYQPSGRYYDNVTFALKGSGVYDGDLIGVPIPKWAIFAIAGLLLLVGGARLRSRNKA